MTKNLIIDQESIHFKLKRMAYEILENHYAEKEIHLIGIVNGGLYLAKELKKQIQSIQNIKVIVHELAIDKKNPHDTPIHLSANAADLEDKVIILVDDVINTGKITFHAFKPLLSIRAKVIQIAVLVDRRHKKYPVYSDYVGNKLTTTIQEYISVTFEEEVATGVYLS